MSITDTPLGVCAIGASAGGLEPLSDLVDRMPTSLGVAFLVAQHLSSDHDSVMVKLLGQRTSMPVARISATGLGSMACRICRSWIIRSRMTSMSRLRGVNGESR